jgi:hypothetical protein
MTYIGLPFSGPNWSRARMGAKMKPSDTGPGLQVKYTNCRTRTVLVFKVADSRKSTVLLFFTDLAIHNY